MTRTVAQMTVNVRRNLARSIELNEKNRKAKNEQ